ncbi:DUF1152 domain-containing protein [Nocardia sp. XZ_19_369]|uniref:DUF1152 domain-containing protein n=1 Tax=Nocardia sp. XZ_19_369 TaxID=2769487 RepID=UPI00188EFBB7|nr:DUF1152 domain-containing protein [Nocardia sp. XZ_19_369]
MTSTAIAIAAGGGGDVVAASVLAQRLRHRFDVVAIMSYSWDRLIVDPTPGPRGLGDFDGLTSHHELVAQVTVSTVLRGPGRSTLPPLAHYVGCPLLLMDPVGGVAGLAAQFGAASRVFGAQTLLVVDVGGDILAEGTEAGLRSPLADSMSLAAAVRSGLGLHLLVAGLGLDGELTPPELTSLLQRHGATEVAELGAADVTRFAEVWNWHPSEASGLLCVAADGWRGRVETQRDALIDITDDATIVYEVDAYGVAANSLAANLIATTSLADAEQRVRTRRGYSDIDIERDRVPALARHDEWTPAADTVGAIDRYAYAAANRGVNALTIRRVLELAGASGAGAATRLRELLKCERPHNMRPPLYLA